MMAEIVNLHRARKAKARDEKGQGRRGQPRRSTARPNSCAIWPKRAEPTKAARELDAHKKD